MVFDQGMAASDQQPAISQIGSELAQIVQAGKIPNALLFSGTKNTGKNKRAVEFAKTCNCTAETQRPCNNCLSCKKINAGMHPDILQVFLPEKKKMISISQIRGIGHLLSSKPNEARWRMVLIADADKMNVQAQNALLKMLEEPPENTFFVLTAAQTTPLLPTILSRCRQFRFRPPSSREIQETLIHQYGVDPERAHIFSRTAGSDLKKALLFLDLDTQEEERHPRNWQNHRTWIIQEIIGLVSARNKAAVHNAKTGHRATTVHRGMMLAQKLSLEPDSVPESLAIIRMVLRDLCVFKYSPDRIVNLDFFDAFKDISQMHVYNTFLEWTNNLEETERRLASNSSIRLTLDRFFLKLSMV
jgi:DNA polymerase III subunit delta'